MDKKNGIIAFGVVIILFSFIIGAFDQEADSIKDIYIIGSVVGLVMIIVGGLLNSQGKSKVKTEDEFSKIEFDVTKDVEKYLYLDEKRKKICISTGMIRKIEPEKIFNYSDILNYELLEDGNSISKGGVGRALVGGALFGGVGAIVGGSTGHKQKQTCTKLQIKITLNNIDHPTEYINFISIETRKDSLIYKNAYNSAQEVLSTLDIICNLSINNENKENKNTKDGESIPEQIKEYKKLLDSGAITKEEYEAKKKQLLNL